MRGGSRNFSTKKIGQRVARFRQINAEQPTMHHDALEFPDGQVVLLTSLCDNQYATVLQMPAAPRVKTEAGVAATDAGATVVASAPRDSLVV